MTFRKKLSFQTRTLGRRLFAVLVVVRKIIKPLNHIIKKGLVLVLIGVIASSSLFFQSVKIATASSSVTQTTDIDFGAGTFSDTAVNGMGSMASVGLSSISQATEFGGNFSSFSNGGQFGWPDYLTVDIGNNKIYVADGINNQIIEMDSGEGGTILGDNLSSFGEAGSGEGQFDYPTGIDIDTVNNKLYVMDRGNSRIVMMDSGGGGTTFGDSFVSFGTEGYVGDDPGNLDAIDQFAGPYGVSVDAGKNKLYITDTDNNRIVKIDSGSGGTTLGANFTFFGEYGSDDDQFDYPVDISVDATNDKVFITDFDNSRIIRIDDGEGGTAFGDGFISFGTDGSGDGQISYPMGLSVDSVNNKLYIGDTYNDRIVEVDSGEGGTILGDDFSSFGETGSGDGQFNYPQDVYMDAVNGKVYVGDDGNGRIAKMDSGGSTSLTYETAGTFTSDIIDTGPADDTIISWSESGSPAISMKVRSGTSSSDVTSKAWSSCDAIISGSTLVSGGCSAVDDSYVQYQATFTSDGTSTALLDDVTISFTADSQALSPDQSIISVSPSPATINDPVAIAIAAYDTEHNPITSGGSTVSISVTGANTATPTVTDNGDGTYTATYTPTSTGTDLITATIDGESIGQDNDGTSDGTFNLLINTAPTDDPPQEKAEKDHLTLIKSKNDTLTFDALISKDKEEEASIPGWKDQATQLEKVELQAAKTKKLEGQFKIKHINHPTLPVLPISLTHQTCTVYSQIDITSTDISGREVQKTQLTFDFSQKFQKAHPDASYYALWNQDKKDKQTKVPKQKIKTDSITAESSELEGLWTVLACTAEETAPAATTTAPEEAPEVAEPSQPIEQPQPETPEPPKQQQSAPSEQPQDQLTLAALPQVLSAHTQLTGTLTAASLALPLLLIPFETGSLAAYWLILKELFSRSLGFLGWRKKDRRNWGIVYDLHSGRPIPLATVQVIDETTGKVKETRLTDSLGSYSFLVAPGRYLLDPKKTGFQDAKDIDLATFPAWYANTYRYTPIETKEYAQLDPDLPMYSDRKDIFRIISNQNIWKKAITGLFYLGAILNLVIFLITPSLTNAAIMTLYLILGTMRTFGQKQPRWGIVTNSENVPQPFTTVKLYDQETDQLIARTITDEWGRYCLIADPGDYRLSFRTTAGRTEETTITLRRRGVVEERVVV